MDSLSRIGHVTQQLAQAHVDLLLVSPSADLLYLIGYAAHASERPTILAVPVNGQPQLLVPQLEAPRLESSAWLRLIQYNETDDPYIALQQSVTTNSPRSIAVSDQMWAANLLRLQAAFGASSFQSATRLMRDLRMVKGEEELRLLTEAAHAADAAFRDFVLLRFAGRTEHELGEELTGLLKSHGLTVTEGEPIVASGPNSASPHHMTGNREVHEGDALVLDFGGTIERYQADITRTVHVGTPSEEFLEVYACVKRSEQAGVERIAPGVQAQEVDRAAREKIEACGRGDNFIHRTGHGIGLEGHEEPYIVEGNELPLAPGMTFSVEPGIYLPGKFGVRIEDIVAVTATGSRRLNEATRELVVVH